MRHPLKNGFTLLEVLLYIAITATMLGGLVIFMALLTQARVKDQTITEVTAGGTQLLQFITQAVHNASAVSVVDSSTFAISDAAGNQSTIALSGAAVEWRANQAVVPLTSNKIIVNKLVFTPVGEGNQAVRIELILASFNPSGRIESSFNQTWYATATLRP